MDVIEAQPFDVVADRIAELIEVESNIEMAVEVGLVLRRNDRLLDDDSGAEEVSYSVRIDHAATPA